MGTVFFGFFFFPFVFFDVSISDWMKSVAGVFPVIPAPVLDTQTCFDKLFFRLRHRGLQQTARFVFHPGVSTSQGSNLSEFFFFVFFLLLHRFIFYSKVDTYLTGELDDRPVERLFNGLRIPTSLLLTLCLLRHNVTTAC